MKRSKTPTFITEIPLTVSLSQESVLLKRLEAGRRVYNACLGEALQRAQTLHRSPAYQAAREFPTHTTRLSQVCLCGAVKKKPLSQRWHRCACEVMMQCDLFSAFLAMCVEDEQLNAEKARAIWPGLESVLRAALSDIESVSGSA